MASECAAQMVCEEKQKANGAHSELSQSLQITRDDLVFRNTLEVAVKKGPK